MMPCASCRAGSWSAANNSLMEVKAGKTWLAAGLRLDNPQMTMAEIGRRLALSRERVRQILKKRGLPTDVRVKRMSACRCRRRKSYLPHQLWHNEALGLFVLTSPPLPLCRFSGATWARRSS
jgi:hypothetical protein